ncbi:hypothetical protein B5X24_HaOG207899 [Helicoverpa armigera]|uniref:Mediator of RNA polymerase II transcription subunit 15 n=1 Tax=Helicoverpa armigera TaxID=29058 RepID=A0A2W1BHQ7_HELAM|nr:hypothetical protein B5X24_HaOG207899 [Helicoverpa armigera]
MNNDSLSFVLSEQALEKSGKNWPSSGSEIENTLFVKSKNAAEYADSILQLVKYINHWAPKDEE